MSEEQQCDKHDEDSADATARMLPCPSCGEADVDATFAAGVKGGEREERFYNAGCMVCGMMGPDSHTPRDAADRWNALPRNASVPSHALPKPDAEFVATMAREYGPEAGEATADHLRASVPSTTPRKLPFSLPAYVGDEYQGMHTVFAADHAIVAECYHSAIAEMIVKFFNGASAASAIERFTLDTPERVCFYEQEFYVLSNFSSFKLNWAGLIFDTAEHAYHWTRFQHRSPERQVILESASAHDAFRFAQKHKSNQRSDWDAIKVNAMKEILRAKADQHEYVRRKLLETGERELVENSWRDPYWGWGPNRDGLNRLGKLWMEVRADLRRADGGKQTGLSWLIEAPHVRPVKYWAGEKDRWTEDPCKAARFPNREAADKAITENELLAFSGGDVNQIVPVEHMFGCGT